MLAHDQTQISAPSPRGTRRAAPSPSKMRHEDHRLEDPLGYPLRRATAEEEASRAAERGHHCVMHRRFRASRTHTHHTIPGGLEIETANGTLTETDETGGRPLLDARP